MTVQGTCKTNKTKFFNGKPPCCLQRHGTTWRSKIMYKIGELSKLSKLPVKTLRYYDNEGILPSDYIDETTGYRYYNAGKLSDCYRIIVLKELGFSLCEIKELISLPKEYFSKIIQKKEEELLRLKAQTEERIHLLRSLKLKLKENASMFDIVIRKSDSIRTACKRMIVSDKEEYGKILEEMRRNIPDTITGSRTVVIDYEVEFVSQDFDTGFGVEITGKLPKSCGFSEKIISFAGDVASLVCDENSYDEGVHALHKYVLDHDYQITGPVYKIMYEDGTVEIKLPVAKLGEFDISRNEEIDLPFVNDEEAVGHWETLDYLPSREMFHPQKQKSAIGKNSVKELYFLPGGERYWCFGWTKGLLLTSFGYPYVRNRNQYTIEKIGGETFMFVEFKDSNYNRGGVPEIWVLRKTDSKSYNKREIRITDEIPNLPADDNSVMGKWNVCDFVRTIDNFDPQNLCNNIPYEDLYWRHVEFLEDGSILNSIKNMRTGNIETIAKLLSWVTGYVICRRDVTASRYVIRKFEDTEYLFIQWKSGDYIFGGDEPAWYVFRR